MKNNTTDTKRLIQQAIANMPDDYTLSEARYHLRAALSHVEHVEQKRLRREAVQKQNAIEAQLKGTGLVNPSVDLRENLKIIDELIAAEQKKLEEIVAKRRRAEAMPNFDQPADDDLLVG